MDGERRESRVAVIEAVRTPLALLALVVLLIEGALAGLAVKATGRDFTILVVGLVAILATVVVAVLLVLWKRPDLVRDTTRETVRSEAVETSPASRYDVFVSAPMAGFGDDGKAYQRSRSDVLRLIRTLKEHCGARTVFYAGETLPSVRAFEAADLSLDTDLEALRASRCFVLVFPASIATSALVEVGVAIGLRKPVVIHVLEGVELPYLLRHEQGPGESHGAVHIYRYANFSDILHVYENNPEMLRRLEQPTRPAGLAGRSR